MSDSSPRREIAAPGSNLDSRACRKSQTSLPVGGGGDGGVHENRLVGVFEINLLVHNYSCPSSRRQPVGWSRMIYEPSPEALPADTSDTNLPCLRRMLRAHVVVRLNLNLNTEIKVSGETNKHSLCLRFAHPALSSVRSLDELGGGCRANDCCCYRLPGL